MEISQQQLKDLYSKGLNDRDINLLAQKFGYTISKPSYISRVGQQYKEAGEEIISGIQKGAEQIQEGEILRGVKSAALRTVGGVAKPVFTPITEAPVIKPILEKTGEVIAKIPGVETILKKVNDLAVKYPEEAKDLQNIIDILSIGIGKTAEKSIGIGLEKKGIEIEKKGIEVLKTEKAKFAEKLVMPKETAGIKLEQVPRTIESGKFLKKDIVVPTKLEKEAAEVVSEISNILPKNTFQKNFNLIADYNKKLAQQLELEVAKNDFIISKKIILSKLNKVVTTLTKEHPLIIGDAKETALRLIQGAEKIIKENKGSGSGLLKTRKEFDSWVLSQKPKAFDTKAENAFSVAKDAVRNTLNTILDENIKNVKTKILRRKQSALYRAMDNVAIKAADEANSPLLRVLDNLGKVLGIKSKVVQGLAAAVGIGGLGAAATFAPAVVGLGGASFIMYKAGKFILKPEVRIQIGKLLQTSGKLLNPEDVKILQDTLDNY